MIINHWDPLGDLRNMFKSAGKALLKHGFPTDPPRLGRLFFTFGVKLNVAVAKVIGSTWTADFLYN